MTANASALLLRSRLHAVRYRKIYPRPSHFSSKISASMDEVQQEAINYSSGRWLFNENARLAERQTPFNFFELPRIVAESVGKSHDAVRSVRKFAEGGFNRVFEVIMKDGTQLLARIPYPSTFPQRLATASEVATMDFVRMHGIPTPRVYDYSCDSQNALGTEYIIMEKLQHRSLGEDWFDMSERQLASLLKSLAEIEAKLFAIELPAFGSVFYSDDLPREYQRIALHGPAGSKAFCIGPDVSLENWFRERTKLTINRGPFYKPQQLLQSVAEKEAAWIRAFGRPRHPWNRAYKEFNHWELSQPSEHLRHLDHYIRIAPYLIPSSPWLNRPILRHPDLQPNNVMITKDFSVAGLIDWQHAQVLPLFLHAGIPTSFQNYDDTHSQLNIEPRLPSNFEDLPEEEKSEAMDLFRRRQLHFYYLASQAQENPTHFRACSYELGLFRRKIFTHAGAPWEGNNVPLAADLIKVQRNWSTLLDASANRTQNQACPIAFGENEMREWYKRLHEQEDCDETLAALRRGIGIASDGWVPFEHYDRAVAVNARLKASALAQCETDFEREKTAQDWPFDDHDEDE